jgi:Dolichol-phosphate mannosyltransferase subunit 3 (DPM3)
MTLGCYCLAKLGAGVLWFGDCQDAYEELIGVRFALPFSPPLSSSFFLCSSTLKLRLNPFFFPRLFPTSLPLRYCGALLQEINLARNELREKGVSVD